MINLHSGGELVTYEALRELETPAATASHVPLAHFRLVDLVRGTLAMFGHSVVEEHHATDYDNMRYFGLLTLKSDYTGYTDTLGLRNANDRAFPVGIGFGSRVFVCSNLAFMADHVIKRRHTANLKRDLPGIVAELIEPLTIHREKQHATFQRYKQTMLTSEQADHAILDLYREGVVNIQRVPDVMKEWSEPSFPELEEPSIWRLFNAVTFTLNGRVMENPQATPKLHRIMDAIYETVH